MWRLRTPPSATYSGRPNGPRAVGIFQAGMPIGTILAFGTTALIADAFGIWRAPFLVAAIPGMFVAFALFRIPEPERCGSDDSVPDEPEKPVTSGSAPRDGPTDPRDPSNPLAGVERIFRKYTMSCMHVEGVDLNLLKALEVLLEERHVSRAAARAHLTQSAMSRALGRLRETFEDELLVRHRGGYELTPRARSIQDELAVVMPRLRLLLRGSAFDPATATATVRIAGSDYAATVIGERLFPEFVRRAPHMSLVMTPVVPTTFADLDHGRIELALTPIDAPDHLNKQALFTEDFVCALASSHSLTAPRLTVEDLASYPHVMVAGMHTQQQLVVRQLEQAGVRPRIGITVPHFNAAALAAKSTSFIAVLPRRLARHFTGPCLRIVEAPSELAGFSYPMVWHPRVTNDPVHRWLRSLLSEVGATLRTE